VSCGALFLLARISAENLRQAARTCRNPTLPLINLVKWLEAAVFALLRSYFGMVSIEKGGIDYGRMGIRT
jgi:hypothetical protein